MKALTSLKNRINRVFAPVVNSTRAMAGAIFSRMENWSREIMSAKINGEIMFGLLSTIEKCRRLSIK